jgi:hypothetical protein
MSLVHSQSDERVVSAQLGRPLRGEWAVAHRCHLGLPTVIENHPVVDGAPFPTLFWLTCPLLNKRVSRQESEGRLTQMTRRLASDPGLRSRLAATVARYRARRDSHAVIGDSGSPPGGGPDKVKCLHAHAAHELADPPNPIGALALAESGFPDCRRPCVAEALR